MMARKRWTNTVAMAALLGVMSSPAGASGLMTGWFEIEEHLTFASPNSGGSILVKPTGSVLNPANCTGPSGTPSYYAFGDANPKAIQAALLGAVLARREVRFFVSQTDCSPGDERPLVLLVRVR